MSVLIESRILFIQNRTGRGDRGRARGRCLRITTGMAAYGEHRMPAAPEGITGSISEIGYLRASAAGGRFGRDSSRPVSRRQGRLPLQSSRPRAGGAAARAEAEPALAVGRSV